MTENLTTVFPETFVNPVYSRSFPDPFVLKYRGEYFAYCTDFWRDGNVFGVLRSRDLVNWTEIGGAMKRLENDAPFYWAPEVTYANGKFYLYYSVGNETLMEIRVAISDRPDGGFEDCGAKLTTEDFAIDAHVFTDENGERYLFYATDFLEHSHIGTGTVVDKMLDWVTLAGNPRPVTRAKYDWQVYDPNRKEKGGVRWHTVEGAFVLKRKGIYYEMFSGGNWQNITYGVSFAITDDIEKAEEWEQFSDGEKVLPILRTVPDLVIGPGHNSVVRGTNNRELFCVYHRWTENGRVLAIDRMDFAGTRIFIKGATHTPQIAPYKPSFADFFDDENPNEKWKKVGEWKTLNGAITNEISEKSVLIYEDAGESFLCEFSLRAVETADENSSFGFCLSDGEEKVLEFRIFPNSKKAEVVWLESGGAQTKSLEFAKDFDAQAFHLLRVETDNFHIKLSLDEAVVRFEKILEKRANQIRLAVEKMRAAFSGFALTQGFEDSFDWEISDFENLGWQKITSEGDVSIENKQLVFSNKTETEAALTKGSALERFEFAGNIRLAESFDEKQEFGFSLLNEKSEVVNRFSIKKVEDKFYLADENLFEFQLPESFVPENYHQFRFLISDGKITVELEENILGEISSTEEKTKIGLFCKSACVSFDMIRLTKL